MIPLSDLMLLLGEIAIISLGSLIIYLSFRAYRRNRSRSMLFLSLGFLMIVAGSMVEEILLEMFRYSMIEAHIAENLLLACGLLVIVYSIYGARG